MHVADRGGKSFLTSRVIYRVTVYFRLKTYQREKNFLRSFWALCRSPCQKLHIFSCPAQAVIVESAQMRV